MAVVFQVVRWRNMLSTGSQFTEVRLDKSPTTLIVGENGSGKCLDQNTRVDIRFEDKETENKFKMFLTGTV
jgi:hypothetical protein